MIKFNEIIKSMFSGQIATVVFLISGYLLDKNIPPDIANLISLFIGGIVNFFLQSITFTGKASLNILHVIKFIITDSILFLFEESSFIEFHKYFENNTLARLVISSIGFIFISFPLRKFFVFN
jgi:putative flippase GtrA